MRRLNRILCRAGIHRWSQWTSIDTPIEATTGHDVLDSIDDLYVTTKTRECDHCGKGHIKQVLKW
jgi:hypothetical protein